MKELYLDSANLEDIGLAVRTDAVAGVTTNPSLMSKEFREITLAPRTYKEKWDHYVKRLNDLVETIEENASSKKHLSVEVISLDSQEMYDQARKLHEKFMGRNKVELYVKIPVLFETLDVISKLSDWGARVNATAVMNHRQAKLAHDAGARIVSFFYNRMKDGYKARALHEDSEQTAHACSEIHTFAKEFNRNTRIICGSIRKSEDISNCWVNGADIVTASLTIIRDMLVHPQTEKAVHQFQEDIDKWLS